MKTAFRFALPILLAACGGSQKTDPTTPAAPPADPTPVATEPAAAPVAPATPAEPPKPVEPPDAVTADSSVYKTAFENDSVRVLEVNLKAGAKVALHKHPDNVVYSMSGGKVKFTGADGQGQEVELKPGMSMFAPAGVHASENVGTTDLKAVLVELRKKGAAAPAGKDPLKAGGKMYKLVFEDSHVRVLTVTFAKGQKIAAHTHPDHVAYAIEGGKLKVTEAGKPAQEIELATGAAAFLPAQVHAGQNVGKTPIKLLVVELKP